MTASRYIYSHLKPDRTKAVPLSEQLEKGLRAWVAAAPPSTRLPAERLLAQELGVDRGTVKRAIMPLVAEGLLTRRAAKGTFTTEKACGKPHGEAIAPRTENAHPLLDLIYGTAPVQTNLRVASFEQLPAQLRAWNSLATGFNEAHRGWQLTIDLLDARIASESAYRAYVREGRADLILLPFQFVMPIAKSGDLALLPDRLQEQLEGKGYLKEMILASDRAVLRYAVPLTFGLNGFVWNPELLPDVEAALSRHLTAPEVMAWLVQRGQTWRREEPLFSNVFELGLLHGTPDATDALAGLLQAICARYEALAPVARHLIWHDLGLRVEERLLIGQIACFAGPLYYLSAIAGEHSVPWKCRPLFPAERACHYSGCTVIAANAHGKNVAAALDALPFFAKPEAMQAFSRAGLNATYHVESNAPYLQSVFGEDAPAGRTIFDVTRLAALPPRNWHEWYQNRLLPWLRRLFDGEISAAAALKEIARQGDTLFPG